MKVEVTFLREVRVILLHHSVQFGSLSGFCGFEIKSGVTLTNVLCYSHNSQAYCEGRIHCLNFMSLEIDNRFTSLESLKVPKRWTNIALLPCSWKHFGDWQVVIIINFCGLSLRGGMIANIWEMTASVSQ